MGFTIGLGVLGGFLAITPVYPPLIIYLVVLASTFWIAGFDIIYTIPDMDYDRKNNLKTLNVKFGLRYDRINPRKKDWALVAGRMKMRDAYILAGSLIALFEISTYFLNMTVFELSPIVILFFIADPLMKRITCWRHLFMGFTIGLGVLGGFLAGTCQVPVQQGMTRNIAWQSVW